LYSPSTGLIEEIRAKFVRGEFEFSKHATDQSILHEISVQEIREVVSTGTLIEDCPDDKYGPSCLVFDFTRARRPIHVQCSYPSRPFFSPQTVEQLHRIILGKQQPARTIQTPVFEFAS
jgi:hypothetical protein